MGSVLYLASVFAVSSRDDLEPARGAGIATLLGLLIWTTAFAVWNWVA
jgi:hypothetical protein